VPELPADLSVAKRRLLSEMLRRRVAGLRAPVGGLRTPGEPAPLSFPQERLWRMEQQDPANPALRVSIPMRLTGPFDPGALDAAVQAMVARHEVLRTRFELAGGAPMQAIAADAEVPLSVVDLRDAVPAERLRAARDRMDAAAGEPFDLSADAPIRLQALRLGDEDCVVQWLTHHVATDAWSIGLTVRELSARYDAERTGQPAANPALPLQYADFAIWQRLRFTGPLRERELDRWAGALAGAPAGRNLFSGRRPAGFALDHRPVEVPGDVGTALGSVSARAGATLYMTLLAGFAAALAPHAGEPDLLLLTPVAGRLSGALESLIGFFVNRVIVRLDTSGDPPFAALVERAREAAVAALAHQEAPLEAVLEDCARRLGPGAPRVQAMFSLQNAALAGRSGTGGRRPEPLPAELAGGFEPILPLYGPLGSPLDVSLVLVPSLTGHLAGALEFNREVVDGALADLIVDRLVRVLAAAARAPEHRISRLAE
jgi:hypothetical protein